MDLMGSLGLDQVEADPNAVPDGRYDGVITRSELAFSKNKNNVGHTITYKVTSGANAGAQHSEWFTLGTDPVDANGNRVDDIKDHSSFTVTMDDTGKQWYKKRLQDLGFAPEQIGEIVNGGQAKLVGIPVVYGVKQSNGYRNVNFAERSEAAGGPYVAPRGNVSSQTTGATQNTQAPAATPAGLENLL